MKSSLRAKVAGLFAALALASAAFAASPPRSKDVLPTPDSSTRNLSQEASGLLAQLHQRAYSVRDSADLLEGYNREPLLIDWRIEAETLSGMQDQINKMDRILYRLQNMEKALPPEQRAEINEATPAAIELTDTAQAAIDFLNHNQQRIFVPSYTAYAGEMSSEAGRIERSTITPAKNAASSSKLNQSGASLNSGSRS